MHTQEGHAREGTPGGLTAHSPPQLLLQVLNPALQPEFGLPGGLQVPLQHLLLPRQLVHLGYEVVLDHVQSVSGKRQRERVQLSCGSPCGAQEAPRPRQRGGALTWSPAAASSPEAGSPPPCPSLKQQGRGVTGALPTQPGAVLGAALVTVPACRGWVTPPWAASGLEGPPSAQRCHPAAPDCALRAGLNPKSAQWGPSGSPLGVPMPRHAQQSSCPGSTQRMWRVALQASYQRSHRALRSPGGWEEGDSTAGGREG